MAIEVAEREGADRGLQLHLSEMQRWIPEDVGPDPTQLWPDP